MVQLHLILSSTLLQTLSSPASTSPVSLRLSLPIFVDLIPVAFRVPLILLFSRVLCLLWSPSLPSTRLLCQPTKTIPRLSPHLLSSALFPTLLTKAQSHSSFTPFLQILFFVTSLACRLTFCLVSPSSSPAVSHPTFTLISHRILRSV